MDKHYHHGMLKEEMIAKGLQLLNKEGYEGFSLRKVAALCGVSHAAPYKHFKSKDELIATITREVVAKFQAALEESVARYGDDPQTQIVDLGKQYVKFMVENPEYLKFLFLSNHDVTPVLFREGEIIHEDDTTFAVFAQSAVNYLVSRNAAIADRAVDILTMWCVVHGLAVLIVNNSIAYSGDYLELIEKILREKLQF